MSKEKQIEKIIEIIRPFVSGLACEEESGSCEFVNCQYCRARDIARKIYGKGYRKQSEGEWLQGVNNSKVCSICGKEPLYTASGTAFATTFYRVKSNYCPHCGAKMKGGAEE